MRKCSSGAASAEGRLLDCAPPCSGHKTNISSLVGLASLDPANLWTWRAGIRPACGPDALGSGQPVRLANWIRPACCLDTAGSGQPVDFIIYILYSTKKKTCAAQCLLCAALCARVLCGLLCGLLCKALCGHFVQALCVWLLTVTDS